jgi:hypothetical protein
MRLAVVLITVLMVWPARRDAAAADVTPPPKPAIFQTVEELNDYLRRLNEYYLQRGRPRFG